MPQVPQQKPAMEEERTRKVRIFLLVFPIPIHHSRHLILLGALTKCIAKTDSTSDKTTLRSVEFVN